MDRAKDSNWNLFLSTTTQGIKSFHLSQDGQRETSRSASLGENISVHYRPGYLLAQATEKVAQLQRDCQQMQQDELQLQEEIKKLNTERQEFITKARREQMPDEEFSPQISALYDKEKGVQRRLTGIEQTKDAFTKLDSEEQVKKYVSELQSEMAELIHADPQIPEERHQVFMLKKQIVDRVLVEVRIDENRAIHLKFRTDFLG
jgi:DNA repair exonuclease SbcCD ATPase subunit